MGSLEGSRESSVENVYAQPQPSNTYNNISLLSKQQKLISNNRLNKNNFTKVNNFYNQENQMIKQAHQPNFNNNLMEVLGNNSIETNRMSNIGMKRKHFTQVQSRAPEPMSYLQKRAPAQRQQLASAINDIQQNNHSHVFNNQNQPQANVNELSQNMSHYNNINKIKSHLLDNKTYLQKCLGNINVKMNPNIVSAGFGTSFERSSKESLIPAGFGNAKKQLKVQHNNGLGTLLGLNQDQLQGGLMAKKPLGFNPKRMGMNMQQFGRGK